METKMDNIDKGNIDRGNIDKCNSFESPKKIHKNDIKKKIGSGVYGDVYETTNGIAIKKFKFPFEAATIREISILNFLKHPNIVKTMGYYSMGSKLVLTMEKAKCDLQCVLNDILEEHRPYIIWQLLNAISYIHSFNIAHRDIKPSNILVFNGIEIKICDFGLAKTGVVSGITHTNEVITMWYRSPEAILNPGKYDYSVDIWSIGVILLQMIFKDNFPLMDNSEIGILFKTFNLLGTPNENKWEGVTKTEHWKDTFPKFKGNLDKLLSETKVSEEEKDILKRMLTWVPNRITAADALKHPYFDKIRLDMEQKYKIVYSFQVPKPLVSVTKIVQDDNFNWCKTILFSWLWEIKTEIKASNSTLFTAYRLFESYAKNNIIIKRDIQLVGISCFNIASRLLDIEPIDDNYSAHMTDNAYTCKTITNMIGTILFYFGFNLLHMIHSYVGDDRIFNLIYCMLLNPATSEWEYEKKITVAKMILNKETSLETKIVVSNINEMTDDGLKFETLGYLKFETLGYLK